MVKHWPKISCNGYWSIDLNIGQHIGCRIKHNTGCTWSLERTWPLWAYRRGWPRGRKCRRAWTRWRFPEWRQACKGRDINTREVVFICALLRFNSSKIEVDENYSGSWMVHCIAYQIQQYFHHPRHHHHHLHHHDHQHLRPRPLMRGPVRSPPATMPHAAMPTAKKVGNW